ncbi:hypothetical protein PF005_g6168 [Phytophthora fragariae]|uniref:Uncharacterized protein n=2 Tax=Phytophthora TaxID=4783 RepID=A0A6A3ZXS9_9STRA|nr:hypothetical protein PF003_g7304 [Phytophthora fragariae]KAE9045199.1 hypothetical protein PR002_g2368 [Phytophthora rubi]KAE8943301.1 hypothetical protein PF009_g6974 [Phytophthora fragariae]KAE9020882.1 hypothetical protein PF011_g5208 [Phytophthora fragariae]KAE9050584.1 hypothetical protein PR001_g2265 [Phytophthora rubi]
MADGYDPQKSRVAEDTLADFLRAPLTGDLTEVPGIGKAAVTKLGDAKEGEEAVDNTFQLIGKFLMLKANSDDNDDGVITCAQHCDAFWFWLKSKGITAYRSGIVMAIAEKVNTMLPGIYDAAEFQ